MKRFLSQYWIILIGVVLAGVATYAGAVVSNLSCDTTRTDCETLFLYQRVATVFGFLAINGMLVANHVVQLSKGRARELREFKPTLEGRLNLAIKDIFDATYRDNIRANVMLIRGRKQLYIYCYVNMTKPIEIEEIRFKKGHGASGVAWEIASRQRSNVVPAVLAPTLESIDTTRWGLSPFQKQITDDVKWIMSIPLVFDNKVYGVLNFDGVEPIQVDLYNAAKPANQDPPTLAGLGLSWGNRIIQDMNSSGLLEFL